MELGIWITIAGLIIGIVSLIIMVISLRHDIKQSLKSQKYLSDIVKNQRKQIKIYQKQVERMSKVAPDKRILDREKLELKRREQENKEKWKQVDAIFKTIKLFADLED